MDMLPVDYGKKERLRLGTDEITVLASCADTGGALFAVEVRMPPGGGPPMMHQHDPGEVYYVLDGEFTFYTGVEPEIRRATARTGDVVPLAGATPHSVRNESDADAVAFVVHAPGAPMENFSRAVAELASMGNPDMSDVLALAQQCGIEMLGPIPERSSLATRASA